MYKALKDKWQHITLGEKEKIKAKIKEMIT
jgi:hypothetical protein